MKNFALKTIALSTLALAASVNAYGKSAILIGYPSLDAIDNFQEYAAAKHFVDNYADGEVITPSETSKITDGFDCIWIHIDRLGIGKGNLPAEFTAPATISALKSFLNNGGSLYLTKHATQLLPMLERVAPEYDVNIYGDGEGGRGTDVWTVNAQIGYMNNGNEDPEIAAQFYDQRGHAIYNGLEVNNDYSCETFGLLGTGDGTEMHREDHNCCWDLNAYKYTAEGRNTVEKFQNQTNSVVLGTWGHVVDYAVAGIVEFKPTEATKGTVIANGLAACEWAPRDGVNGSEANHKKLTDNAISYLAKLGSDISSAVVLNVENANAEKEYFTLDGMKVNSDNLSAGLYIVRQGDKVSKLLVK